MMAPTIVIEDRLRSGYQLSHPPPGDEVFITGISGSFPDTNSVMELKENLFNKVNLVSGDGRRWHSLNPDIPQRTGKIYNIKKFDASFFDVHYKEAHTIDPMARILLEKTYEAIIDAGINPVELRNIKTGIFVGTFLTESEKTWFYDKMNVNGFGVTCCARGMLANRLSNWLGVTGPSYTIDTACSSSMFALEHAFRAIRDGRCEVAIVGGTNLCLHPYISFQFARLGVLSPDGNSKSFDNSANGYVRSEAIVACVLQKAKDSRRVYAQLLHAKTNCDGYKEEGTSYPSGEAQKMLLEEFYQECSITPSSVEYVEAHGTGTRVGDPEELGAIDEIFCTGRSEPLLIGSVKSNLGHSEAASGLCSIAKLCIAYSTGYIPPNIHYKTPREGVAALTEGRLQVVTDRHPWNRGMAGANSFGFGGANAHALLKNVAKDKVNNGLPIDDLPRLVCVSGRTESAVAKILNDLETKTVDVEVVRLWHAIHNKNINGHVFRGFTLLRSTPTKSVRLDRDIKYFSCKSRPVWFIYSDMGTQWASIANQLMRIAPFKTAIERCHKVLEPKGINLTKIISETDPNSHENVLNSFIGVAAVQIGLTDVLKAVDIKPDYIIGHGVGELGCAYADGCLTAEEAILVAYSKGRAFIETSLIKGSMAVVGLGYNQIKEICPHEIDIAHHSSGNFSTISGPTDAVNSFVGKLAGKAIFTNEVPCSNTAYHSRYVADAGPKLLKYLKEVIPNPKPRSERWVSTSISQPRWKEPTAVLSSAEYHTNNLLAPVLFEETCRLIHPDAITIEIGPYDTLQNILHQSLEKDVINIPLTRRGHEDNVQVIFTALGKLYKAGLNPDLANIYPHVPFPVSQGTPMLSHLVEWEHSEDWFVASFKEKEKIQVDECVVTVSVNDEDSEYLKNHVIDGRNLYPGIGYLVLVWDTLCMMMGELYSKLSVVFENVRFHRATNVPKTGNLEFIITIQKGTGYFEVVEGGVSVVTGRIYTKKDVGKDYRVLPLVPVTTGPNVKHMLNKDFYKELRLRRYQYSGPFRGVLGCNIDGTRGRIAWINNWVTFIDCMLQLKIIRLDTRGLFVPTRIDRLSIDADIHYNAVSKMNPKSKQSFEVRMYPDVDVIRAGGVEIRGLHATPISKKVLLDEPVLERNEFVPNFGWKKMNIDDVLRVNMQLILENVRSYKIKSIELVDEEYRKNHFESIIIKFAEILKDVPIVQAEFLVISENSIELPSNIAVENKKIATESNTTAFIGANLLKRPHVLEEALTTLNDKCFIISREKDRPDPNQFLDEYHFTTIHNTNDEHLVMFRKKIALKPAKFIKIVTANNTFPWIDEVKKELAEGQKIVLYSQHEEINGLLGLVNCLRREPGGEAVHGLLIADPAAPEFNPDLDIYEEQLNKDLALNVWQDGQWGTYRHLLIGEPETVLATHAYVNTLTIGDLSSLRWLEGPLTENFVFDKPESVLIHVYCSALNFRDIMTATGRVTVDAVARGRLAQECVQGMEVVGRTQNGTRVMAVIQDSAITNMVQGHRTAMFTIPEEWTFEEAATVPLAYGTAYYAMIIIGRMQRGESILIHAGSGGVGQAAINVALHYGCEVFTTVGTEEKRAIIKKLFPQIKDSHIGNSRDTSFENMVRKETMGKGVDLVLNSLSDEKLQTSIRCLGYRGRFLEIGKFDISNNTPINMHFFVQEMSFHCIMFDFFIWNSDETKKILYDVLVSGIKSGAVRPLTYCIFEKHQIETAYRHMAAGKHIGKVIIKIREEEPKGKLVKPKVFPIHAMPRYMCHKDYVYIIIGGLGGFGLELADWLVLRGARKLLLSSHRGVSNGYQSSRLRAWASYGADVQISTYDVTTESGCEKMLNMAKARGHVEAIFNLAVILKDSVFQNQTPESFKISFMPKALTSMYLDKLSRKLCPGLKDFVVFSSVSCGRGNAGQTNYGFSNSVMERICESRKKDGLPALAIQWGVVGDVGLVADMRDEDVQLEIGGTLQQSISSCLLTLDTFLKQDAPVVSSIVVAEKKVGDTGLGNLVDTVAQIIGISDLKTVSQQASLAELGMDSLMAVEIKQIFEREFEVFLTAQDIRTITFAKLLELNAQRESVSSTSTDRQVIVENSVGVRVLMTNFGDEKLASEPFLYLPTMTSKAVESKEEKMDDSKNTLFMLPGLEGCASALEPLCRRLETKVCVLQLGLEHKNEDSQMMVDRLYHTLRTRLSPGASFSLLGYSFGCNLILELAAKLESEGRKGIVFCLDGAPEFAYSLVTLSIGYQNDTQLQNTLICHTIDIAAPNNNVTNALMEELNKMETFDDRVKYAIKMAPLQTQYSNEFLSAMAAVAYDRLKVILNFNTKYIKKINSPIVLLRPKENPPFLVCEDNYGLNKFTESTVTVHYLEGNHITIVDNQDCANIINRTLAEINNRSSKTAINIVTSMIETQRQVRV